MDSIWRQAGLHLSSFNSPAQNPVPVALQEEARKGHELSKSMPVVNDEKHKSHRDYCYHCYLVGNQGSTRKDLRLGTCFMNGAVFSREQRGGDGVHL